MVALAGLVGEKNLSFVAVLAFWNVRARTSNGSIEMTSLKVRFTSPVLVLNVNSTSVAGVTSRRTSVAGTGTVSRI